MLEAALVFVKNGSADILYHIFLFIKENTARYVLIAVTDYTLLRAVLNALFVETSLITQQPTT